MQRYELIAGSSSKFWEAEVEGGVLKVRFGRIGTQGQAKDKTFSSADAARREFDKLVKEKTSKGYAAAGEGPAVAPPAAPAPTRAPPETESDAPAARVPAASPKGAPPYPHDGSETAPIFVGTPIPSRMRPGTPLDAAADWAAFVHLVRPLLREAPLDAREAADELDASLEREPPRPLAAHEPHDWIERLLVACPAMDQRIHDRKPPPHGLEARRAFAHFARWLVAHASAAALVGCLDRLLPHPEGPCKTMPHCVWMIPNATGVRAALAGVAEAEYEDAVAAFLRCKATARDRDVSAYLAYALGDDRPHADHDLRVAVQLPLYAPKNPGWGHDFKATPLIADLPPSQAAPWHADAYQKAQFAIYDITAAEAAATVIDVARRAGEPATASLAWLLRDAVGADRTTIAKALLETRADDALEALLPFVSSKLVRDALDVADETFPAWMLRAYLSALDGKGEAAFGSRIAALIGRHGADTARAWATAGRHTIIGRLERLLVEHDVPLAPREAWPAVVADPPWRRKITARERAEIVVAPIPTPFAHGFAPGEGLDHDTYLYRSAHIVESMATLAAEIAETERTQFYSNETPPVPSPIPPRDAPPDVALAWLARRLTERAGNFHGFYYFNYGPWLQGVGWQPEPLALLLWDMTEVLTGLYIHWRQIFAAMVSRFGAKAVPGLVRIVETKQVEFLPSVTAVGAAELAPIAANALHKVKRARAAAVAWLRANPSVAAMRLLPVSLGHAGPERDAADMALRTLATERAGRAALDAAIAAYAEIDPRVTDAAARGVDDDPLLQVPSKPPKLPPWIVPAALARPRLASGEALPDAAIAALCEMLAFSSPLTPYAGIALVREACTRASLDAFALSLFQAWLAAGANVASEWAMRAMGAFGGDACARDLTRQIRAWGQAGLKPRGKAGIAVLAEIGTDLALMNLSALAEKNPLLQLREAAGAAIAAIAEARGLDEVELADRLSPDLGLDDRGGLDLDFGPRRFRVGFDEALRPWVRDVDGKRLPALPRATKADDAETAKAAGKLWAGLKKDAEATARLQIGRLETMLATGRRIAPAVYWPFFAAHPLVRHLAGRLVWGLYDDALPTTRPRLAFRLAEDLSASDDEDAPLDIEIAGAPGLVGLAHPLHLEPDALARWAALFGDYEIAQPFSQLARETFALTPAEAQSATIDRFAGVTVAGRRLRGLRSQGWETDANGEHVSCVQRRVALPDGTSLAAVLGFRDGFFHSPSRDGDGVQTLEQLRLTDDGWRSAATRRFGDLDQVTASEVLRTPSLLAATGGA